MERYKTGLIVKKAVGKYLLRWNDWMVTKISLESVLEVILVLLNFHQMNSIINYQWQHSNEANWDGLCGEFLSGNDLFQIIFSLYISFLMHLCKNFFNWLRFDKVTFIKIPHQFGTEK